MRIRDSKRTGGGSLAAAVRFFVRNFAAFAGRKGGGPDDGSHILSISS
jgi:hypothetical protein